MGSIAKGGLLPWWQAREEGLQRWVRDLIHAELAALRPGTWRWPAGADVDLLNDAGVDSLEMLSLQGAIAEALDLRTHEELMALHERPSWRGWVEAARLRLQRDDATLGFATSGTSGRPQRHRHLRAELEQEMDAMGEVLAAHPSARPWPRGGRILSAVRAHHIYGFLFTVMLPTRVQGTPADLEVVDLTGKPAALAATLARPGDLVVGFPDWWAQALRPEVNWPAEVVGVTSTAPCPASVSEAARKRGLARWLEIYGSTETAGVAWRDQAEGPFELHRFWRRAPTQLPQTLQRLSPAGDWGLPLPAPDRLEWLDARRFRPTGRHDGVVQVGGINVDPQQVRAHLMSHPSVSDAAVRLTSATGGPPRLKAFVVLLKDLPQHPSGGVVEGHELTRTEAHEPGRAAPTMTLLESLEAWCRDHLPPAARPVHIRLGTALPRNEMGKLQDWSIPSP